MREINELALFAGAGGGLLASQWLLGWRTVCYVENDPYRVEVLKARIGDGLLDDAPIWDDVRTFDGRPWCGCVDVVTAGFPCQPFSVAGQMAAQDDGRNLWPDTIRIVREVRPQWCLLENVPGLLAGSHGYFGQILQDLAESGYDARWKVLSAAELGAPHKRDRLWIVAVANTDSYELRLESGRSRWSYREGASELGNNGAEEPMAHAQGEREATMQQQRRRHGLIAGSQDVADADRSRQLQPPRSKQQKRGRAGNGGPAFPYSDDERQSWAEQSQMVGEEQDSQAGGRGWWATEPGMGRVADELAYRMVKPETVTKGEIP